MTESTIYRKVTPVYNCINFSLNIEGEINKSSYKIYTTEMSENDTSHEIIVNDYCFSNIKDLIFSISNPFYRGASSVKLIVIDFEAKRVSINHLKLLEAIEDALLLCSERPPLIMETFTFQVNNLPERYGREVQDFSIGKRNNSPSENMSNIHQMFSLKNHQELSCVFYEILELENITDNQSIRIFKLAIDYLRFTVSTSYKEHAFLTLMIIYEALFKADDKTSSYAAKICSHLITNERKERKKLMKLFTNEHDGLISIRNQIAHGDVFDKNSIQEKYPELLKIVKSSIIATLKLICLKKIGIDHYSELADCAIPNRPFL